MIIDYLESGDLDISVIVLDVLNVPKNLLVIRTGNPAEAEVQLLFNLKLVQRGVKRLLFLQKDAVNLEERDGCWVGGLVGNLLLSYFLHFF